MCVHVCMSLTGVDSSPESDLWSTQSGVDANLRSEFREDLDLGQMSLKVFTPEELEQNKRERRDKK